MGTSYCKADDVRAYLGLTQEFSGSTNPTITQVESLINQNEDRIDRETNHAWRIRKSGTETANDLTARFEYYDLPDTYDVFGGGKIYLKHRKIFPFNTLINIIDGCEDLAGWSLNGNNSMEVTPDIKRGGVYALSIIKKDIDELCFASKTIYPIDFTGKTLAVSVYVSQDVYGALAEHGTALEIRFGSSPEDYYFKSFAKINIIHGWNTFSFSAENATDVTGAPILRSCGYLYLGGVFADENFVFGLNDFVMDDWGLADDVMEVWNGNYYTDYLKTKTEGRNNDYWIDYEKGIVYLRNISLSHKNALRIKYHYGDSSVPDDIKRCCILMTAIDIIMSDDRSFQLPEGGSAVRFKDKIDLMEMEVQRILATRREYRFLKRN